MKMTISNSTYKRRQHAALVSLAAIYVLATAVLFAQDLPKQARKTEDPKAAERHAPRGSAKEKENFKKAAEPQIDTPKKSRRPKTPPGGEVTESLSQGERPSLRFLEKKRKEKFPQHQNRLENKRVRNPREFEVEYNLPENARVAVTIVREDGVPMRHFEIPPGREGAKAGTNRVIAWDGRDNTNREAPAGQYFVFQSIHYEKSGKKENRVIPVEKKRGGRQ